MNDLFGYPVHESDDLPKIGDLEFGDFVDYIEIKLVKRGFIKRIFYGPRLFLEMYRIIRHHHSRLLSAELALRETLYLFGL